MQTDSLHFNIAKLMSKSLQRLQSWSPCNNYWSDYVFSVLIQKLCLLSQIDPGRES